MYSRYKERSWETLLTSKKLILLTRKLHIRDEITYQHSIRAAAYAISCGRALGLPQEKIRHLYHGMLLHDIGKLKISLDILYKKEALTNAERKEIQRHPEYGYSIISEYSPSQDVQNVVLYHHEQWDGNGYPAGLRREEIPLIARIAAIADAYEAMTSDRPYKKGISHEAAIEEIKQLSRKKFDPYIAYVFCTTIEKELRKWDKIWTSV